MLLGAVFEREIAFAPRSRGLYIARAVYAAALLAIIATCWLVVTGTQSVATAGDTARWMDDDCVTRRSAFWVQGFLNTQGPEVLMIEPRFKTRMDGIKIEVERQACRPRRER